MSLSYKFDPEKVNYFASTNSRGKKVAFGIKAKDRLQHIYVIGKTGMGKSTMLENMAIQDILEDEGLCFIDPHGSSAERLLKYIPKHRVKDTLYFAPHDTDFPVAFNIFEDVSFEDRHIVSSTLLSFFKELWQDAFSAELEYLMQNIILALLEYPNTNLLDMVRLLASPEYRHDVIANVSDMVVKKFWSDEFPALQSAHASEITTLKSKINQLFSNPILRNIIGQSRSSFDMREFMDERKILVASLPKNKLTSDITKLLSFLLLLQMQLDASKREYIDEENMVPFYLYLKSFQDMESRQFADFLPEAKKYRVATTLSHMQAHNSDPLLRAALFSESGSMISFKLLAEDAELMEQLYTPNFSKEDLISLEKGEMVLSLMIDSVASKAFKAKVLEPVEEAPYDFSNEVIEESRKQFARSRSGVEELIAEIDKKRGIIQNKTPEQEADKAEAVAVKTNFPNDQKGKNKNNKETISPAEILRKEKEKEPQGLSGPSAKQDTKADPSLAKMVKELSKSNPEKKTDKNTESIKDEHDPLQDIKPDQGVQDSVFERAAKLLDSLKRKSQSGVPDEKVDGSIKNKQAYEATLIKESDNSNKSDYISKSKDSTPQEVSSSKENESNVDTVSEKDTPANTNTNTESKHKDERIKSDDEKLKDKLEAALQGADKMSDDELKEILESLLYDDIENS